MYFSNYFARSLLYISHYFATSLHRVQLKLGVLNPLRGNKLSDAKVEKAMSEVINPILSKLKCNTEKRYEL